MFVMMIMALAMQGQSLSDDSGLASTNANEVVAASTEADVKTPADSGKRIKIGSKFYAPDDKVCKREAVTGTRLVKRYCNTAAQWELIEINSRALADELQRGVNSTRPLE